jgi:hypothetical protein
MWYVLQNLPLPPNIHWLFTCWLFSHLPPAPYAPTACFPGDALVQLADGTQKPMTQVARGDMVLAVDRTTGALTYSKVVLMAHAFEQEETEYIAVTTTSGRTLRLSPQHLMQRSAAAPAGLLEAAAPAYQLMKAFPAQIQGHAVETVAAELVKVGDTIFVAGQGTKALTAEAVTAIKRIVAKGIYAPLTLAGNLVVDGVLASAYTQDTYTTANALGLKALHHLDAVAPSDWLATQAAAIAEVGGIMEVSWAQRLHMIGSGLAAAWWGNKGAVGAAGPATS